MTFVEEMILAARGLVALIMGRRNSPDYFDLSPRGLVGSFIAFAIATGLNAFLPMLLGADGDMGLSAGQATFMALMLFGLQIGFAALMLRQIGRLDGLMPYLVADNWATFYITLLSALLSVTGMAGEAALFLIAIVVIVIEIQIARLIVTLRPLQIAAFLIAQLVGVTVGLLLLGALIPAPAVGV